MDDGVRVRAVEASRAPGGEDGPPIDTGVQVEVSVVLHDVRNADGDVARFGAGLAIEPDLRLPLVGQVERGIGAAVATFCDLLPVFCARYEVPFDVDGLTGHARRELALAGVSAEDPEFAATLLGAVACFAAYGHSGGSHGVAVATLERLLRFQPLTALTADPAEWCEVADVEPGVPLWQNRRDSRMFSRDRGVTYWCVDEAGGPNDEGRTVFRTEPAPAGTGGTVGS